MAILAGADRSLPDVVDPCALLAPADSLVGDAVRAGVEDLFDVIVGSFGANVAESAVRPESSSEVTVVVCCSTSLVVGVGASVSVPVPVCRGSWL